MTEAEARRFEWLEACEVLELPPPKHLGEPGLVADFLVIAKKAYRGQIKVHHPDKGGDEDAFMIVQDAWRIVQEACTSPRAWGLHRAHVAAPFEPHSWTPQAWTPPAWSAHSGPPPPPNPRPAPSQAPNTAPPNPVGQGRPFSALRGLLLRPAGSTGRVMVGQGTPLDCTRFCFGDRGVVSDIRLSVSSLPVNGSVKPVLYALFLVPIPRDAVDFSARIRITASFRSMSFSILGDPVNWTWGASRQLLSVMIDVIP